MKFRKLPVEIEAELFDGSTESVLCIRKWAGQDFMWHYNTDTLVIPTLEGNMTANNAF